jgi:predicted kinase
MNSVDKFKDFIDEGVNDPGIFKAIYMAGGPGSGKSYVAFNVIPKSSGLKTINSDELFELGMKKNDLDPDLRKGYTSKHTAVRTKAKQMTGKRQSIYMKGRLGLAIDGTGKDFKNIKTSSEMLKSFGYDTYMIFVNTSLEVALERNKQRQRSLPKALVIDSWNRVQNNIGKAQNYFGANNFIVVDNNNAGEDVMVKAYKQVQKFLKRPMQNKTANDWIKQQKELK